MAEVGRKRRPVLVITVNQESLTTLVGRVSGDVLHKVCTAVSNALGG